VTRAACGRALLDQRDTTTLLEQRDTTTLVERLLR
jgi:hypothetical protein